MDLIARFFGKVSPDEVAPGELVARKISSQPLSLQLLVGTPLELDEDGLTLALRSYHRDLESATVELLNLGEVAKQSPAFREETSLIGLIGWGDHVVQLVGIDAPMPDAVLETCLRPAHIPLDLKQRATTHKSHILLYYVGRENDPLEQYVALAAVSAALAKFDAMFVLNESGHTAQTVGMIIPDPENPDEDTLAMLRAMPIPLLYSGFVKIEIDGMPGVWVRTYGNHMLGLPDFAMLTAGHQEGSNAFEIFSSVLTYLRESKAKFAVGHSMQLGDKTFMKLRAPTAEEYFLESEGTMFVAEFT